MKTAMKVKSVRYVKRRVCDVFPHMKLRREWWFILDENGKLEGNHFETMREMIDWIDQQPNL